MRRTLDRRGISVVEVLIALGMITVVIVSVGNLLITLRRIGMTSARRAEALNLARASLEVVESQRDQLFACTCPPTGADTCDDVPSVRTCHAASDYARTCTYIDGLARCWFDQAAGITTPGEQQLVESGGAWSLQDGSEPVSGTRYTRSLSVTTETPSGAGGPDTNFKLISATVSWTDRDLTQQVHLSSYLSAWRSP